MKDLLVNNRYRVERKIGEGGCGLVYSGTDLHTNKPVAIKLSEDSAAQSLLQREAEVYGALAGRVGIPHVRLTSASTYSVLIEDLLGPSLEDLFRYCGCKFTLKTILMIADQAINRISYVHSRGFLHRDIKPENFLMGVGRRGNVLHIIDFGLSVEREMVANMEHRGNLPFNGTCEFATIRNHKRNGQSWADDLEALGYVLLYFALGSLPWQALTADTNEELAVLVGEQKMSLSGAALCDGVLPKEFATYIDYTRSLPFNDKPDYAYLRKLLRGAFDRGGFKYDHVYDWTEKRFNELYPSPIPTPPPRRNPQRAAKKGR
ncbi:casein kinase 1, delta subunit [Bombardia bombarda]|uniref:non-specific serine/threonine protein kinase n=1 Tax=Bombardia bombarda TaxID=252184 RepID=A0AA39WLZ4_9PEZI|nr:casein kinase 1, delta subunit [Bombardia bombarda]